MGRRRRAAKKVNTKKKATVAKVFKCPFCSHDDSVDCKLDQSRGLGSLKCRICGATYQNTINYLTEPIDIFYDWIDACEAGEEDGVKVNEDDAHDIQENEDEGEDLE